jgi:archaellum component FlaC
MKKIILTREKMKIKLYAIIGYLVLSTFVVTAQDKISLLEIDKVNQLLELSTDQFKKVKIDVDKIKSILEEDKKILSNLRERFKNDDEPGFFEKIGVKRGRDKRIDKIEDLLEEIEDQLNKKQKILFSQIEKPKLNPLSKKELTE